MAGRRDPSKYEADVERIASYAAVSGGWIEPDGTFHPCDYGFHDSVARKIATERGIANRLDMTDVGWIRVLFSTRGTNANLPLPVYRHDDEGTQAQLDMLHELSMRFREIGADVRYLEESIQRFHVR